MTPRLHYFFYDYSINYSAIDATTSLLSSLFAKKPASTKTVRMCVLGLDNAGKTTILKALTNEDIQYVMPTQGFNGNFKFEAWDLGGQKAIRSHWKNYYEKIDCIIFVIDSSDRMRMNETGDELQKLLEEDKLAGLPLLIYANKQDLISALPAEEIEEQLCLGMINDRPWTITACSAKDREGKDWRLTISV